MQRSAVVRTTRGRRGWTRAATATAAGAAMAAALMPGSAVAASDGAADRAGSNAGSSDCAGRSVPASKISVQMYSFIEWADEVGVEQVMSDLSDMGYKNIEPYGGTYGDRSAEEFAALLKEHHLKASSAHSSTDEATWDQTLDFAKTIGQDYVGSAGSAAPGLGSYEDTLATAETLNRLGERAKKQGFRKVSVHNHQSEFTTTYQDPETGETKSAWQLLVENTDPRYVTFQVDVLWAADAGVDVVELLETYGDRIEMLHVKDGFLNGDERATIADVGEGEIDWAPILRAAHQHVKYYVLEYDFPADGENFAQDSFDYLTCLSY